MISKLFKRLADLPGVNWFNHKDKIERELPVGRVNPKNHVGDTEILYRLATKYFEKIVIQDQLIFVQKKLIDTFDEEVSRWDLIQADHEKQIQHVRQMEDKVKKLELTRTTKVAITSRDIDKLIKHLDIISARQTYSRDKAAKKYREMHQTLHNFLQKLKVHADIAQ